MKEIHPIEVEEEKKLSLSLPESRKKLFDVITAQEEKLLKPAEIKFGDSVSGLISQGKLVDVISLLRIQKDNHQGIISYYTSYEGNKIFIRDATEQKNVDASYYDWAILGINYAMAAKSLLESHGIQISKKFENDLYAITNTFVDKIANSPDPEISLGLLIYEHLLPLLMKNPLIDSSLEEQIKEQLAEVRDFGNFEHEPITVVTKTKVKDSQFTQVDMPLMGSMSNKLSQEYQTLLTESPNKIAWYANQDKHIKYLIRKYAKKIVDGKAIIPTQLRKYFPGIRNGGEEILAYTENGEVKIIQRHYHSGTPGHFLKNESQEATNESIEQLGNLTGAKNVLVLTLLSPRFGYFGEDGKLVKQVRKAVEKSNANKNAKTKFHTSNVPLNFIRGLFSFTELSGADWLLNQAKREIFDYYKEIDSPKYQKLEALIKEYKKVRRFWKWNPFSDSENRYLQLASVIEQLGHAVNEVHRARTNETEDFVVVAFSCQSGKDRAGLSRIRVLIDSIKKYFKITDEKEAKPIIDSGQVQAQAGFSGGTIGAHGLKEDTKPATPSSWKDWINILFKKTASYNKELPKDPRELKKYKENKANLSFVVQHREIKEDTPESERKKDFSDKHKYGPLFRSSKSKKGPKEILRIETDCTVEQLIDCIPTVMQESNSLIPLFGNKIDYMITNGKLNFNEGDLIIKALTPELNQPILPSIQGIIDRIKKANLPKPPQLT